MATSFHTEVDDSLREPRPSLDSSLHVLIKDCLLWKCDRRNAVGEAALAPASFLSTPLFGGLRASDCNEISNGRSFSGRAVEAPAKVRVS